jgi:hypothetical protein
VKTLESKSSESTVMEVIDGNLKFSTITEWNPPIQHVWHFGSDVRILLDVKIYSGGGHYHLNRKCSV